MGRPKKFSKEEVLQKSLLVFWEKGFAQTNVQDIEKATGVNKSGLYSEFKDKEDIYVECLKYHINQNPAKEILTTKPLGWDNIEKFLSNVESNCGGCFVIGTMKELPILPVQASEVLNESCTEIKMLVGKNIAQEKTKMAASAISELIATFYTGLSMEQNLNLPLAQNKRKIKKFMEVIKSL